MSIRQSILIVAAALLAVAAYRLSPLPAEERTWTDSTGKHSIDAEFVRFKDGEVTLRKANGKRLTLQFAKLSKEDQQYIRRKDESRGTGKKASDRASIREVSKKFFKALREDSDDDMGTALSEQALRQYEAKSSPVENLPAPDSGASIRVGRVSTDGDTAVADVSVRVRGKFQKTTLSLRRESDAWRIHKISAKGANGELVSFDFEEGGDASSGGGSRGSRGSESDDELFAIPKGGPVELLRFIKEIKEATPPRGKDRNAISTFHKKRFAAVLEAAENILDDDDAANQHEVAIKHKFDALKALSQLGVPGIGEKLDRLPDELEAIGLTDLVDSARSVGLLDKVGQLERGSASKARALYGRIEKHLQSVSLGNEEILLARATGKSAEGFLDEKAAGAIYTRLGKLLVEAENRSIAAVGKKMQGVARRLTLLGNEMHVEGLTLDGTPIDWPDYKGKVILVDYWATWCGPCIQEMPNVKKAYEEYHEKGFDVVGISLDTSRKKVEAFVESKEIPWVTLFSEDKEATGWDHPMASYYGISAIPATILIGPDGKVVSLNCRGKRLGEHLDELLGRAGKR